MPLTWKRAKIDDMQVYTASDEYNTYEIRSWPYDESGDGRFQLCRSGYHVANCSTLTEAKQYAEKWLNQQ